MKDDRVFVALRCEYGADRLDIYGGECSGNVKFRTSMTAYSFSGKKNTPEDPNRKFVCCDSHYEEYVVYWEDMWSNVPRG